jgi:uncharacterized protein (TIGR02246 family)
MMKPSESCRKCLRRLSKARRTPVGDNHGTDVDFVTVGARWFRGRADFEKYHSRLLSGRFKEASLTLLQTEVRILHPDMGVIHWSWKIDGDKNFDGTPRQRRFGMMTMVAQKPNATWQVIVAQNTNALPGTPPEIQDIKSSDKCA